MTALALVALEVTWIRYLGSDLVWTGADRDGIPGRKVHLEVDIARRVVYVEDIPTPNHSGHHCAFRIAVAVFAHAGHGCVSERSAGLGQLQTAGTIDAATPLVVELLGCKHDGGVLAWEEARTTTVRSLHSKC